MAFEGHQDLPGFGDGALADLPIDLDPRIDARENPIESAFSCDDKV